MAKFLDDLKNAVDKGEFNSDAAKKINEIDKLADKKENAFGLIGKRLDETGYAKSVSEEEAAAINSDYEKKMEEIKKQNMVNKQLATLIEIEDLVKADINDMMSFIDELEDKFAKEFDEENPICGELNQKIEQIKLKYNSNINN